MVNELATGGFNIRDIPVDRAIYDLYRNFLSHDKPEPGRRMVDLHWRSGDKLVISDGRSVTSMRLNVAKGSDAPSSEPVQTYRLACIFDARDGWHKATITVGSDQQVDIVNERPQVSAIIDGRIKMITPVYWKPISDSDVGRLLTVFHDALQAAKPIDEDKKEELKEHNELSEYIKQRWPNGFPDGSSAS